MASHHPWGEDVVKVSGKVFVFLGPPGDKSEWLMGVKLTRSLLYARSRADIETMGYGLGKSGWCKRKAPGEPPRGLDADEAEDRRVIRGRRAE